MIFHAVDIRILTDITDARIPRRIVMQELRSTVGGSVIGNDILNIPIRLTEKRFQSLFEEMRAVARGQSD